MSEDELKDELLGGETLRYEIENKIMVLYHDGNEHARLYRRRQYNAHDLTVEAQRIVDKYERNDLRYGDLDGINVHALLRIAASLNI
jgi:hypothetical protein